MFIEMIIMECNCKDLDLWLYDDFLIWNGQVIVPSEDFKRWGYIPSNSCL